MTIVCGIDFSERAAQAARAAAAIARRLDVPLMLVHVVDELGAELAMRGICDPVLETRERTDRGRGREDEGLNR